MDTQITRISRTVLARLRGHAILALGNPQILKLLLLDKYTHIWTFSPDCSFKISETRLKFAVNVRIASVVFA